MKHTGGRGGKTPPLTGRKLERLSGLPPHPAQGLLCDSGPRGGVAAIRGSPQPLSSPSLDLPSFTQRYLGQADLQGVRTPYAALWIPGCGEGRLPQARALSQGPHRCSQQLGEISAAVGCQFSGRDSGRARTVGRRGEECLRRVGPGGEVVCTHPFLPLKTEQEKRSMKSF